MNTAKLLVFLTAFFSLMLNTAYGGDDITGSVDGKIVFSVSAAEGEILIQSTSASDAGQEPGPTEESTTEPSPPSSTTGDASTTDAPGSETDDKSSGVSGEPAASQADSESSSNIDRMIISFYERGNIRIGVPPNSNGWMRLTSGNDSDSSVDLLLGDPVEPSENPDNQGNQNNQDNQDSQNSEDNQTETFFTRALNAIQNSEDGNSLSEPECEVIRTLVSALLTPNVVQELQRMMTQGPVSSWSPRRTWAGSQLHHLLARLNLFSSGYDHVSSSIRVPTNIGQFTHESSNEAYRIDGSVSITFSSQKQPENFRKVSIQLAVPDSYSATAAGMPTAHCKDGKKTEVTKDHEDDKDPDGKNPDSYYGRFMSRLSSLKSYAGWKTRSSQASESSGSGQSTSSQGNKEHADSTHSSGQPLQDNQNSASYSSLGYFVVAAAALRYLGTSKARQNAEVPVEVMSISSY